jgi:uncharacterized OsmC-like protein
MPTVFAEAHRSEGRRIVFGARTRSFVNVREGREDGPIGFTSIEMLLMALGNCALGTVMESSMVAKANVQRMGIHLDADMLNDPRRLGPVAVVVELQSSDPALKAQEAALTQMAATCPVANTLSGGLDLDIRVTVSAEQPCTS